MDLRKPRRYRREADVAAAACAQRFDVELCLLDEPAIRHIS
jgi:hypothetical protein